MSLREFFNEHKWHRGDLPSLEVVVRHRGAPADERVVPGSLVVEVGPTGLAFHSFEEGHDGGTVWIPYHRVLAVRHGSDVLWQKPEA